LALILVLITIIVNVLARTFIWRLRGSAAARL
jgi:ABC-type phosphate transport system permease subunit